MRPRCGRRERGTGPEVELDPPLIVARLYLTLVVVAGSDVHQLAPQFGRAVFIQHGDATERAQSGSHDRARREPIVHAAHRHRRLGDAGKRFDRIRHNERLHNHSIRWRRGWWRWWWRWFDHHATP